MVTRVAITGFGRIGRLTLRALLESKRKDIKIVALNATGSPERVAHLFEYDSIHGRYQGKITTTRNSINFGNGAVKLVSARDPKDLPWKELDIDVVLECTGVFNTKEQSIAHIEAGCKRVLISAPTKTADLTVVYGVNHTKLRKKHQVISNASCTTNALAPLVAVLDKKIGIENGFMTTVHAYTGDQRLVDNRHNDPRRARAAGQSMIPTSTGAAKSLGMVIPNMEGRLGGTAIRVPTPNVSLIDFVFKANKKTTIEAVNKIMIQASKTNLNGIMGICELPLVSCDFNHNPHSCIFDVTQTQLVGEGLVRILAWYDNEWGFSMRMLDTAAAIGKLG